MCRSKNILSYFNLLFRSIYKSILYHFNLNIQHARARIHTHTHTIFLNILLLVFSIVEIRTRE